METSIWYHSYHPHDTWFPTIPPPFLQWSSTRPMLPYLLQTHTFSTCPTQHPSSEQRRKGYPNLQRSLHLRLLLYTPTIPTLSVDTSTSTSCTQILNFNWIFIVVTLLYVSILHTGYTTAGKCCFALQVLRINFYSHSVWCTCFPLLWWVGDIFSVA